MYRIINSPVASHPNHDSALQGATRAFEISSSSVSKPVPVAQANSTYGALAAAKVGTGTSPPSKPPVPAKQITRTDTGNASVTAAGRAALQRTASQASTATRMSPVSIERQTSPSFIAATRAASRSRSTAARSETPASRPQRIKISPTTLSSAGAGTDDTSIPPTNRLVELFEAKRRSELLRLDTSTKELVAVEHERIIAPTPLRPSLSIRIRAPTLPAEAVPDPVKSKSPIKSPGKSPVLQRTQQPAAMSPRQKDEINSPKQEAEVKIPPTVPAPRKARRPNTQDQSTSISRTVEDHSEPVQAVKDVTERELVKAPPRIPPPRRKRPSSVGPDIRTTPDLVRKTSIPSVLPRRLTNLPPGKLRPHLTADSLANAMVASSLASSRAPSPTQSIRSDMLYRPTSSKPGTIASFFLLHSPTHTPAPPKIPPRQPGLRQTLRASPSSSDNEDSKHRNQQHKHGLLIKKHPNKHAEGARRRWRDSITERERKRYEGVWAANRGLLIQHERATDASASNDDVHSFVVRDIWSRSGLGARVLGEVWELTECGGRAARERRARALETPLSSTSSRNLEEGRRGRLRKDEFVVGMWLVDQCLKGRKLPVEVQESVWGSARGLMNGLRTR